MAAYSVAWVVLASALTATAAFGSSRTVDSSSGHNVCTVAIDNADPSAAWTDLVQNTYDAIHTDNCSAVGDSISIDISVDIQAPEDPTSATGWDTHGLDLSDTNADVTISGTSGSASVIDLNHFNTDYELRFITKSTGVGDITLYNLVIKNGYADADTTHLYKAGAILDTPSNDSDLNITNCSFYHNYGWGSGGAIYANEYVNMSVDTSIFGDLSGNENYTLSTNGDAFGGAIYTEGNFSDVDSIFSGNNTNSSDGGAVYLAGNAIFKKDATFSNSSFFNNNSGNDGGAIFATQNVNLLTVNAGSTFTNNLAYGFLGGAISTLSNLAVDRSTFISNSCYKDGGAIYTDGLKLNVHGSYFETNSTGIGDGGAIYAEYPELEEKIVNDYFVGNEAGYGGAIRLGSYMNGVVDSSSFSDNIAHYAGGAIYLVGTGQIKNSTIWKNFSGYYGAVAVDGTANLDFDTIGFNSDTINWSPSSHDFGNPLNLGGDYGNEFDGVGNLILSDASDSTGSCSMDSSLMNYVVTNDSSCFGNSNSSLISLQNSDLDYASNLAKNSTFYTYGAANAQGPRTIRVTDLGGFDPRVVPADIAVSALGCSNQDTCLDERGYLRGGFNYSTTHFDLFMAGAYEQVYDPEFISANGRGIVHLNGTTWASDGTSSNLDIYGHFFNYQMSVDVDGQPCAGMAVLSSAHLVCSMPANTKQIVKITLTAHNGDPVDFNNAISYTDGPAPTISSLSGSTGSTAGGDTITIHGSNFVNGATAKIGGPCATLTFVSASELTCVTGSHIAADVQVEVDNPDWLFGTADGLFAYVTPSGLSNHTITVTTPTNGTITPGTSALIADSSTPTYTITPDAGYQIASVTVDSTDVTSSLVSLSGEVKTYTFPSVTANHTISATFSLASLAPAPTISSVNPNGGSVDGGTLVTIGGNHFVAGATATIGGSACFALSVVSSTSITCYTSAHDAGKVDAVVTNPDDQSATKSNAYSYQIAPSKPGTPGATAADQSVVLTWTAPITGTGPFTYLITSNPTGATCTISGTTANCSGLTNGTSYVFTVTATNLAGSATSTASDAVTPLASSTPGPVVVPSSSVAYNLIGFGYNSAKLRTSLKAKLRNFVLLNPEATTFVCQGYTSGKKVTKLAKKLGMARAKAVCAFIATIVPGAKVTVAKKLVNIPLSRRARRVRVVASAT